MAKNGTKKKVPCIAAGCRKDSKGPRFHYLCEAHKDTKKSQVNEWKSKVKIDRKSGTKTAVKAAKAA